MYAKVAFAVLLLIAILAIPAVSASQNVDLDIEITPNYNLYPSEWRDRPGMEEYILPSETITISGSGLNLATINLEIYSLAVEWDGQYNTIPIGDLVDSKTIEISNNEFSYNYVIPSEYDISTTARIYYTVYLANNGEIISKLKFHVDRPPRDYEIARYTGETEIETVTATQTETEIRTLTATYTTTATLTNTVSETETETVTTTPTENYEIAELQQQIAEQQAQLDAQQEQLDEQQSWIDILLSFLGLK